MKILNIFFYYGLLLCGVLGAFLLGAAVYSLQNKGVDFSALERYKTGRPTLLLDRQGVEWARFQLEKREPIVVHQMPSHVIQAFIAAEDWDFFSHCGISWRGIIRSFFVNLYSGRIVQGASTITQQLVKLLFLDAQKTFVRKFKEQVYALLVERTFSKEQILQTYLNHVYFGCGLYGVEAASQRFWGKTARALTCDEAALLAGIVRSPAHYCPLLCPLSAEKRRNSVLHKMERLGFITQQEHEALRSKPLVLAETSISSLAPHLKETIRVFLEELVGKDRIYTDGFIVQTTLDKNVQVQAEHVFAKRIVHLRDELLPDIDGALISFDTATGAIRALIGGYDFGVSKFNRALQARRQIGSVFKPLIYACAIEQGYTFSDTYEDDMLEITMPDGSVWRPKNFHRAFDGRVTLAYALYRSSNIVAIKLLLDVGYEPVIALGKKCRLEEPFHRYPSLALGCVEGTLLDVAGMFNVFANNGVYITPHYVSWIKDRWGTKIYRASIAEERVLSPEVTGQVTKVLQLALKRVRTWFPQKWLSCEAISKTGTTNDCRTCWYAGSTPELTTAVYIGCDDNRPMGANIYPLRTSFPIWMGLHSSIDCRKKTFLYSSSLKEQIIHERTGKRLSSDRDSQAIRIFV